MGENAELLWKNYDDDLGVLYLHTDTSVNWNKNSHAAGTVRKVEKITFCNVKVVALNFCSVPVLFLGVKATADSGMKRCLLYNPSTVWNAEKPGPISLPCFQ